MRVLVVEDDSIFGLLIERVLKPYLSEEDTVVVVQTMAEAKQYIDKWGPPDLATLDLNLPDSRWKETLKQIDKIRGQKGCVLVVSGVIEDGLESKAREHGADGFIAKPFAERGFLGTLRDTFSSLSNVPERYKRFERILQTLTKHLEQMKLLLIFLALVMPALGQEWNGTVFPSTNDQKLDSLRKSNKILNDSRTGANPVNVITLLLPIAQVVANGEWNGTVFPSTNDNDLSALRKINKILNDARTGTAPLKVNGAGGGGVTSISGTPNQITVTGTTTPVISLPDDIRFTGSAQLSAQSFFLAGKDNYPGLLSFSDLGGQVVIGDLVGVNQGTTLSVWDSTGQIDMDAPAGGRIRMQTLGTASMGDVDGTGNSTSIVVNDGAGTIEIRGGAGINVIGTPTFNNGMIVSNQATFNGPIVANPANQSISLAPTGTGTVTLNPATLGSLNKMTIGATTPSTGAFTDLSSSGTVSGAGFTARFASPGPIGNTSASTVAATTLSASSTVSGTGFVNRFSTPGPIGDGTPSTGAFTSLSATSVPTGAGFTAIRTGSLGITIDGAGSAITTGVKGYLYCPYACTITAATCLADVSGSIVIEVWKDTYANYPPVVGDKISASAPITLSSAQKSQDTTLTGWTLSVAAGDVLAFNVNSASTVTRVHAVLTTLK